MYAYRMTHLYISNLPISTTEKDLIELFESNGEVIYTKIFVNPYGVSRGTALLRMGHANSCINAMKVFGFMVGM